MGLQVTILDPSMRPLLAAAGFCNYADFVDATCGAIVSQSGTTLTRRLTLTGDGRSQEVYLKRYRYEGSRWRHRFRRHKGEVEAANYGVLRDVCGVGVPDVIAFGGRRAGWRLRDAFLMTRGISGVVPLDRLGASSAAPMPRVARLALLRAVADAVRRMHENHFYHADLQWRNLLFRPRDDGFDVFVIDSSRGGVWRLAARRRHGQIRDLASLDKLGRVRLTRTDRLRWLHAYFGARRLANAHRRLIGRVLVYAARAHASMRQNAGAKAR